jgi:hypothetical protein
MRKIIHWAASLFFVGLICALIGYSVFSLPRALSYASKTALTAWLSRHAEQADRECREYDDAVRDPAAARGEPVRWFISHPGKDWLCGDDRNRPIRWSSTAPDMMETGQSGQSRGQWVRARVDSAGPGGVVLLFERLD